MLWPLPFAPAWGDVGPTLDPEATAGIAGAPIAIAPSAQPDYPVFTIAEGPTLRTYRLDGSLATSISLGSSVVRR